MIWVLDLDNTLIKTSFLKSAGKKELPAPELVPGAKEFLEECLKAHRKPILVSKGDAEFQNKKIEALALRAYFGSVHILSENGEKEQVFRQIITARKLSPAQVVVVGDRLDQDIAPARKLGCTAVQMRFPGGKYSLVEPQTPYEKPNYIVKDFFELMKLAAKRTLR